MRFLIFATLILNFDAHGQDLLKSYDLKGEWFVSNFDSSFFNSDTLIFIKRTNREKRDDIKVNDRAFIEPSTKLAESTEFVNLKFENGKKVSLWESNQGGSINAFWVTSIKWSLKSDTLKLVSDKFTWTFKVIAI